VEVTNDRPWRLADLPVRWENGLFVAEYENRTTLSNKELVQRERDEKQRAEDEFLRMLDKAEAMKQNLSSHFKANNNAAKVFSEDPDCKQEFKGKKGRKILETAMRRLFDKKQIDMVPYGFKSRHTYRLART
jgi:hypothetical protein